MNTKNIFRTLFMAVLLLMGVSNVKADKSLYNNANGSGNNAWMTIQFGAFDNCKGDVLRITYDLLTGDNHIIHIKRPPTNAVIADVAVSENGVLEITIDQDFLEKINTTDQYNNCMAIQPENVTIYKIDIISTGETEEEVPPVGDKSVLWEGRVVANTSNYEIAISAGKFAEATATSKIRIYVEDGNQILLVAGNGTWQNLWENSQTYQGGSHYNEAGGYYEFIIGDCLEKVKNNGIYLQTKGATITKITLTDGDDESGNKGEGDTYSVTISGDIANGTVVASKYEDIEAGETITLTVTPADGYELETILVNDGSVTLEEGENNTYTFEMPASDVTVSAAFKEKESEPQPEIELKDGEVLLWAGDPAITYNGYEYNLIVNNNSGWVSDTDAGTKLRIYATIEDYNNWKLYVGNGNWGVPGFVDVDGSGNIFNYSGTTHYNAEEGYFELEFGDGTKNNLQDYNGLAIAFYGLTINYVVYVNTPKAPTHTLTIIVDGEETTKQVAEGADLSKVLTDPTKIGHTFSGWAGWPDGGLMPTEDLTLEAVFTINSYLLTYILDGAEYYSQTIEYGTALTPLDAPESRDGYTFSGWSTIPEYMPDYDVIVTGRFIKDAEYVYAEIGATGYATFCSDRDLDFSNNTMVKAYYAKAVSDTEVTFTQIVGTVAAGTGLLLVADASTTAQILVAETETTYDNNLLVGVLGKDKTVNSSNQYVLVARTDSEVGVKFADTAAQPATVPVGKAYLQAPSNSRILTFSFADGTTGISAATTDENHTSGIYNLKGMRVTTPGKGLYIINGKKVMIK